MPLLLLMPLFLLVPLPLLLPFPKALDAARDMLLNSFGDRLYGISCILAGPLPLPFL
jgi:hypothetical protein